MRQITRSFLVAALVIFCAGCASTNYQPFVGAKPMVGSGGVPKSVDGIDIWIEGSPPRKFIILGIIDDERPGGRIPMGRRNGDIAEVARANGGDAVIAKFDEREYRGSIGGGQIYTTDTGYGNSFGSAYGSSVAVTRRNSRYYVIKYL